METLTQDEFDALSPRGKGYAVYMAGAWCDQPNVPKIYVPAPKDAPEYAAGQMAAAVEVIDGEG